MSFHPSLSTSVSLALFLYFDQWFSLFYFILGIITYIYKGVTLPFPLSVVSGEGVGFAFFFVLTLLRLFCGFRANLTQHKYLLLLFIILSIPCLFGYIFWLKLQTFILRVDTIVNVMGIVIVAVEMLLGLINGAQLLNKHTV